MAERDAAGQKRAEDAEGCPVDAGVLWHNVMYRGGLLYKAFAFCAAIVHAADFSLRVCWQVGIGHVYKAVREELRCVEGSLALFAVVSARASVFANSGCLPRR